MIILRELTGGVYSGEPKTITDLGNGQKRAVDTQVYDTYEIERIARSASNWRASGATRSTSMEKRNVMKTGALWHEVVEELHEREYKDVRSSTCWPDAGGMAAGGVAPKQFNVIVTDDVRDMLSDVAAMLSQVRWQLAVGIAGRARCEDQAAQGHVRAGARLGARHRRQGHGESDCDARIVRHGDALFVQHGQEADQLDAAIAAALARAGVLPTSSRKAAKIVSTGNDGRGDCRRVETLSGLTGIGVAAAHCAGTSRRTHSCTTTTMTTLLRRG